MFILQLEPPHHGDQGDHQYRTAQPCKALGMLEDTHVVSGNVLSPLIRKLIPCADVLIQCLSADHDVLPFLNERQSNRHLCVFEINDNYLAVQPWNPSARFFQSPANQGIIASYAANAHLLQLSMPELLRYFGHFNTNSMVLKNNLWEIPELPEKDHEHLWLGWAGSLGHLEDIEQILPIFKRLLTKHPHLRLAIMGPQPILDLFDWVEPGRFKARKTGSLQAYLEFLKQLHIGICPLQPTDFNLCRSDVKFLEYAANGVFAICANLAPYQEALIHEERGLFFNHHEELEASISRAISDEALRTRCTQNAYNYVQSQRLETGQAQHRRRCYQEQIAELQPNITPEFRKNQKTLLKEVFASPNFKQPWTSSKYWKLEYGIGEAHLYNGLLDQHNPKVAKQSFLKAKKNLKNDYLPELYLGHVEQTPSLCIKHFKQAIKANPKTCTGYLLLGQQYLGMGNIELAHQSWEKALEQTPNYAPAMEALGDLALAQNQAQEAIEYYRRVLDTQRFYRSSAHKLCSVLIAKGMHEDAETLIQENLEIYPQDGMSYFLRGQSLYQQGCFDQAAQALEEAQKQHIDAKLVFPLLAQTYLQLGNSELAHAYLNAFKELH